MTTLEKIKLQKEYKGKRASVQGASTIAKVRLLREAKEILAQLKGTGVAPDPVVDPQPLASIEQVSAVMKDTGMGSGWFIDPEKSRIVDDGVKQGWLLRPSVSQVEWTEAGVALSRASADPQPPEPEVAPDPNVVPEPEPEPITPQTDQDALNEMVKAILNKGGEVTGKQFPDVFFMFYGGVSAKLTAADGGYTGKNIDTGEQSSSMQTADQAMEWLMSNAKENEAKQYQQYQKLTDLLSGKYDDLQPEAYLKVVQDIITEINDVEPVKPALVSYLDKAKAKGLITEAAAAVFEAILNGE